MLDLGQDPIALTAALVDVASVSGDEAPLADLVETALRALPHLDVVRDGNNVVARTSLGREVELEADGAFLRPVLDGGPGIWVNRVEEPKTAKDRVHLDVDLEPGREVGDLLALGASVVTAPGDQSWWVLADPEGHEFCAFLPQEDATNDADAEVPV